MLFLPALQVSIRFIELRSWAMRHLELCRDAETPQGGSSLGLPVKM